MGISEQEQAARRAAVDEARASVELEHGRSSDALREVEQAFVRGEVDLDELLAAAKPSR